MTTAHQSMVNPNFDPNDRQERILDILKEGREDGEPWGRATNKYLAEQTGIRRQYVNRALDSLADAGWVRKLERGFYELVEDPRESDNG